MADQKFFFEKYEPISGGPFSSGNGHCEGFASFGPEHDTISAEEMYEFGLGVPDDQSVVTHMPNLYSDRNHVGLSGMAEEVGLTVRGNGAFKKEQSPLPPSPPGDFPDRGLKVGHCVDGVYRPAPKSRPHTP